MKRLGEFEFIDSLRRLASEGLRGRSVAVGIGDDAASLVTNERTLATTDSMVENVHFRRAWLSPAALGTRAFRVAVSDIAAMGGRPRFALVALGLPRDFADKDAVAMMRGFIRDAAGVGTALVGGNVSRADRLSLTVTVLGDAPRNPPLRANARRGHAVFVTDAPGEASAGIKELEKGRSRGRLVNAYRKPPLRIDIGRELTGLQGIGAMIDVSDGLVQDLGHICRASKLGAEIDIDALPVSTALRAAVADPVAAVLTGGDDYALLFTAPPGIEPRLLALGRKHACAITRIGEITPARKGARVLDRLGRALTGGYAHL